MRCVFSFSVFPSDVIELTLSNITLQIIQSEDFFASFWDKEEAVVSAWYSPVSFCYFSKLKNRLCSQLRQRDIDLSTGRKYEIMQQTEKICLRCSCCWFFFSSLLFLVESEDFALLIRNWLSNRGENLKRVIFDNKATEVESIIETVSRCGVNSLLPIIFPVCYLLACN